MTATLMIPGRRCRWSAAGVFLLIGTAPARGRADEPSPAAMTVRVDYRAASSCPSRDEFLDNVRRYTTKWSLVDDGASRDFAVLLDRDQSVVRGTLEIALGGRKTRKVVSGRSCGTVARALAVMVALVIDPDASISDRREGSTRPGPSPGPTARERSDEAPSNAEELQPPREPQPEARAERAPRKVRSTSRARPTAKVHAAASAPRWMFELRSELSSAVSRRPLALLGGFVDLQVPLFGKSDTKDAWLGPSSIGFGVRQSVPRAIGVPGGSTEFLWSAASMRVCPLRLRPLGAHLDVAPCVEGNIGALHAESHGIPVAQQTRRHWLDGGASVLGVWHLPGPWVATAGLALIVPLTRHRFEVVDLASLGAATSPRSELVSQAPALGVAAGVGLGLEL